MAEWGWLIGDRVLMILEEGVVFGTVVEVRTSSSGEQRYGVLLDDTDSLLGGGSLLGGMYADELMAVPPADLTDLQELERWLAS